MPQKLMERPKYKRPKFNLGIPASSGTPPGLPTAPAPKKTSGARPPRTMNMNIDASRKPTAPAAARKPVSNFSKGESASASAPVIKKQTAGGFSSPAPAIKRQTAGGFSGPSGPVVKKQTGGSFSGGPAPKSTPSKTYKAAPAATPAATAASKAKAPAPDKNAAWRQAHREGQEWDYRTGKARVRNK